MSDEHLPIRVPWVFLSLGDHAPGGKRPIYYRDRGESGARVVGYAEQPDVEILSAACEAYNDQRNAEASGAGRTP